MINQIKRFMKDDSGATMIEYGLLVALVAIAAIVALGLLGTELGTLFGTAQTKLAPPA